MKTHPYLRAYMAGITAPTMFLLVIVTAFTLLRHVWHIPTPIERLIVFPMAIVPNLWGVWNMLYILLERHRLPIGLHGAILPFILVPAGIAMAKMLDLLFVTPTLILMLAPVGIIAYYLGFKYLVGFFNDLLGISNT